MANFKGYKIQLTKGQDTSGPQSFQEVSFNPNGGYYAQGGDNAVQQASGGLANSSRGGLANAVVTGIATRAVQFGLSNYGNLTGDYITHARIEGLIEVGGLIMMASTGIIGATAAISSIALKEINRQIDITKKNQDTELLRQRTGMTTFAGGRR